MSGHVVVTGGAGFIGSSLCALLAARGERVVALDDLATGSPANLEDAAAEAGVAPPELVRGDVRDEALLARTFAGARAVFHLACLGVRHSLRQPVENHDVNATGTLRALEAARRRDVPRFVCVSTSEVYGTARHAPMTEDHPTLPHTVYGASKLAGEGYARAYHLTWGYPTVVVRPFNAYGPRSHHEGDSGEVIPRFVLRALAGRPLVVFGDGAQTRDFTFVEDTARGILEVGLHPDAAGQTVNLGSGAELTINALADLVREVTGRDVPVERQAPRPGDVLRLLADSGRARERFGFAPRVGLREGLERLVAWYRRQGVDPAVLLAREVVRAWEGP
ncbi:MAG: GDP-mannose 4,6-dehydratase [Planctomycetes bacterium]|nr:GDP-mannose 4,6-dehydratase [Planctomycetota bacterium]